MKNMTKLFRIMIVVLVIYVFTCCASSYVGLTNTIGIIDKEIPLKEHFAFYYPGDIKIDTWDGSEVNWFRGEVIILPAGEHKIQCRVDYHFGTNYGDHTVSEHKESDYVVLTYVFEASHYYTIYYSTSNRSTPETTYDYSTGNYTTRSKSNVVIEVKEISSDYINGKIYDNWYVGSEENVLLGFSFAPSLNYFEKWSEYDNFPDFIPLFCFMTLDFQFQQGVTFVNKGLKLNLLADYGFGLSYPIRYNVGGLVEYYPVNRISVGAGGGLHGFIGTGWYYSPYARLCFINKNKSSVYFDYFFKQPDNQGVFLELEALQPSFRVGMLFSLSHRKH